MAKTKKILANTKKSKKPLLKKPAAKKPAAKKIVKKPAAKKTIAKKPVAKKPVAKIVKKAPAKKPMKAVKPVNKKPAVKAPQKPVAKAPVAVKQAAPVANKSSHNRPNSKHEVPVYVPQNAKEQKALYKVGNHVVYPTHGVGKIMAEETQMIGDIELRLLVINFEKDKMTLRVPMNRASAAGLRPISGTDKMKEVYVSLKSKAKISRGMWSRRAQEYEGKINSGNIILISEVVRDLHQNVDQSERSYSERMIYENALNRLVGEVAAAEGTDSKTAHDKLMKLLRAKVAAATALKEAA